MSILTAEVAQRIVDRTMAVLDRNVNVMDDAGLILASGRRDRLRQRHEGALIAAHEDRVVVVDEAQARLLHGVQPGVNVPLHSRGRVVGVVGISGSPEEVEVYAALVKVAAELIVDQAASWERGQLLLEERADFLAAVVAGRLDERAQVRRAVELGLALDAARGCTVIRSASEHASGLRRLYRELGRATQLWVARTAPDEVAVWWPAAPPEGREVVWRRIAESGADLEAADGRVVAGPQSVRRSWVTAHDALDVQHLADGLYDRQDLPLVALLGGLRDDWRAEPVAEPWHRLVAADPRGELRATLRAWFDHELQVGPCAAALHLHRNTLRARLARIESITGLRLRRVPSLLQLYVGPLLASADDDSPAAPGPTATG